MSETLLANWVASCLLLGLRIAPVFAFAPPFNLIRVPRTLLLLFGLGLSIALVSAYPAQTAIDAADLHAVVAAAVRELLLGATLVLAFQLVYGALYLAGRTVDNQAGYAFALIVDPASSQQTPLIGMLFAYAAGGVFFAAGGQYAFLRFLAASLRAVPLGRWTLPVSLDRMLAFLSLEMLTAFGIAGGVVLCLFMVDIMIALMSRTVPQMNVLILGFQVKTIVLLLALPASFGLAGSLFLRMTAQLFDALPRLT